MVLIILSRLYMMIPLEETKLAMYPSLPPSLSLPLSLFSLPSSPPPPLPLSPSLSPPPSPTLLSFPPLHLIPRLPLLPCTFAPRSRSSARGVQFPGGGPAAARLRRRHPQQAPRRLHGP
eukprot:1385294-Rhodomonas_salina.1